MKATLVPWHTRRLTDFPADVVPHQAIQWVVDGAVGAEFLAAPQRELILIG